MCSGSSRAESDAVARVSCLNSENSVGVDNIEYVDGNEVQIDLVHHPPV